MLGGRNKMSRIDKEKEIVGLMIKLYCRKKHHNGKELCKDCEALKKFAELRLDHCRYGENKSFCSHCPTHCYPPSYQEKMREVMRFSGPRMLLYHPRLAISHFIQSHK